MTESGPELERQGMDAAPGRAEAQVDAQAAPPEDEPAGGRRARTVVKVEDKRAGKAAKAADKRARKAAKAEDKRARKAAKAAKAEAKRARKEEDEAAGAKRARKSQAAEGLPADEASAGKPKRKRKDEKRADRKRAKQARRRDDRGGTDDGRRVPAPLVAAGSVLQEVAGLVRQAAEPAAARIVRALEQRRTATPSPAGAQSPERPEPAEPAQPRNALASSEGHASAEPTAPGEQPAPSSPAPDTSIEIAAVAGVSVGAAVDVGANSVHLLVAAVGGHRLEPLVDESVFLGLGDRIDATGYLGVAARGELVAALVRYAEAARRLGAAQITFVGTEPMRRAADAASVAHEVERAAGVAMHVLDHTEEGILTLLGVTAGRPVTSELVVVDIGGGSSEVVSAGPGRAPVAAGLAVGSARLTQRLVRADPPTAAELDAVTAEARRRVAAAPPARPDELVAVGGTASNLAKVIPAAALERVLTRRRLALALEMLATEPSAMAAERHAVNPTRARILPAGALIVRALLEHYGVDRLRVSEDGIREGIVIAAAHAGHAWRDRLPALARGWRQD